MSAGDTKTRILQLSSLAKIEPVGLRSVWRPGGAACSRSSKSTVNATSSSQSTPQPHRNAFTHLRRCLAVSRTRTGTRSRRFLLPDLELCLPRPYICRSGNSGYGKKPYGKTIGKLVTDSFLVAKKQRSISAMGSVHNKTSPDVSAVVSRTLSSYRLPYEKGKDTLSTN